TFGQASLTIETSDDNNPWPGGDKNDFFLGIHNFGLYWLDITFDSISVHLPRVMGDTLINTTGIMGAVLNSDGGKIYIDHAEYSPEPSLDVSNGVFWGLRSWASIPNANTGGVDSKPVKVTIRYEDNNGKVYTDYRTIDYGSWSGNQLFLFDTNQMLLVTNINDDKNTIPNTYSISQNYPNPFNPNTVIQYSLPFESNVSIIVYNILGQEITKLVRGNMPAGIHKIHFDGSGLSSGIYFYSIRVTSVENNKNFLKVKKMVLIK
ncbi:MAG: T9SS type A sorting domain-containing protein, partial [Bacteroidetes bacterium]|nr:T9SS type A sorting domain-containing protein [Bacteroidota bacterium]